MYESVFFIKYPKEYHRETFALTEIILIFAIVYGSLETGALQPVPGLLFY